MALKVGNKIIKTEERTPVWSDSREELLAHIKKRKASGAKFVYFGSMWSDEQNIRTLDEEDADFGNGRYMAVEIRQSNAEVPAGQGEYVLVTCYSFDVETPVWKFPTEGGAKEELERQFKEECRIEHEENGRVEGRDVRCSISPDGGYASIRVFRQDGEDLTEWHVDHVRN